MRRRVGYHEDASDDLKGELPPIHQTLTAVLNDALETIKQDFVDVDVSGYIGS
jgi:hypothetical protein